MELEVGLFAVTAEGLRLLGHSRDPALVQIARDRIAADRKAELDELVQVRPADIRAVHALPDPDADETT